MYKGSLYGVSEVKQNDNGDLITIPLPLTSDNGQFELISEKANRRIFFSYAPSAILRIKKKDNGDIYWNSRDYNTAMFYNPGTFGISPVVNDSDTIVLQLQSDGNLVLRSAENPTLACFVSSVNSKYSTHMTWTGGPEKKPYSVKLTNEGILEVRDKANAVVWKTTYMWESLETPFSKFIRDADFIEEESKIKYADSLIYKYMKKLDTENRPMNLTPFKILPLSFLNDLGRVANLEQLSKDNKKSLFTLSYTDEGIHDYFDFTYQLYFSSNDKYVSIGDPFYKSSAYVTKQYDTDIDEYGNVSGLTYYTIDNTPAYNNKQIIVALVKNDPKYSKPLENPKWTSDTYKCSKIANAQLNAFKDGNGNSNFIQFYTSPTIDESSLGETYTFLGSGTKYANLSRDFFSGVNKKYLLEYNGKSSTSRYNIGTEHSSCINNHNIWMTTPFSTYMINSSGSDWSNSNSHDVFYDLVPEQALLEICLNKFTFTYEDLNGDDKVLDSKSLLSKCNAFIANDYCTGSNIATQDCIKYFKQFSNDPNSYNYDNKFFEFCTQNDNYNKPEYKRLCACYNPDEVYQDYVQTILDGIPEEQRNLVESTLSQPPPCIYPACSLESIEGMPRWNFKRGENCTENAYQFCITNNDIVNEGTINGNLTVNSMINCIQQNIKTTDTPTTDTPTTAPPNTSPPGGNGDGSKKSSSNTLWIVLAVVFVVLIILYFAVFKNKLAK